MINLKQELDNFREIDLNSLEENITDIPDDVKKSVILYNQALESLRRDSEDIAIIELKKAVSLNAEFAEALNLLGLCYAHINEEHQADLMFKKVMASEKNGIKAMDYMQKLNNERITDALSPNQNTPSSSRRASRNSKQALKANNKYNIIKYVLGFTAGVLAMFIFSYSYIFNTDDKADIPENIPEDTSAFISELSDKLDKQQEENRKLSLRLTDYEQRYEQLSIKYETLEDSFNKVEEERNYFDYVLKLFEIDGFAHAGNYAEAADRLNLIDRNKLKENELIKFNALFSNIMPKAASMAYAEGMKLWNEKKYLQSIEMLDKIVGYDKNFARLDRATYYKGKCYQALEKYDMAMQCYNHIINTYPSNNSFVHWAGVRIREIPEEYR